MPEAQQEKIPAQDLLHWELMLRSRQLGCRAFDLAGISPDPATPKEVGIRRFKEKWGGEYVEYYTFERNVVPFSKQLLRAVKRTGAN
jgi:lipid II:glycine glycyltransferase (peptidoglycan interpeptide bridge formation enzyme)